MIVQSYLDSGVLLYEADLKQVEVLTEDLLENFSGSFLGQMKDIDLNEYARSYEEYKSLLYTSPFQFQAELLFVMRALGILSGITTVIAPTFNPMEKVRPFATRLMQEEWQPTPEKLLKAIPRLLKLPSSIEDVLLQAQRGRLSFQTEPTARAKESQQRLRNSVEGLATIVVAVGLFVAGVIWHTGKTIVEVVTQSANQRDVVGITLMVLAGIVFLLGLLRGKRD